VVCAGGGAVVVSLWHADMPRAVTAMAAKVMYLTIFIFSLASFLS
jgi:hypothetical protein